jgi:hypothetical protein
MVIRILKIALIGMLAALAGCANRKTEVHREWFEQVSLHRNLILRHGDSASLATGITLTTTLAGRDLKALADTAVAWILDTTGIKISIPSLPSIAPLSFTIDWHRQPAIEDSLRFQILGGEGSDPDAPKVTIERLEWFSGAPFLVQVLPESLSLTLVGIPFDSAFSPVLPPHSRITARTAVRFRIGFDGRVLEGETYSVEYRFAATTFEEEHEGL